MPLIDPGLYFSGVDLFEEPSGIVHTKLLNIDFELNFDTMMITRCDTKETKPFTYHNGSTMFEAFNLTPNVSISIRGKGEDSNV